MSVVDEARAEDARPVVELSGVTKRFHRGSAEVVALDGVDLTVRSGELVALHGRSGSGKTTLLHVIGGLETPDAGRVEVCGLDLAGASADEVVRLRRDRVAYVFQTFGLLPLLSAAENVEVPLRLHRAEARQRDRRVAELLDLVGLGARAQHRPHELSGGEQQRVAIARALAADPVLLLADEPTGELDSVTGGGILALLRELVATRGLTLLMATHEEEVIAGADRTIELHDGHVVQPVDQR